MKARLPQSTKLRIMVLDGKRRAFALEPAFWQVLEMRAAASDQRLSHLVSDVLAMEPDAGNATGQLRLAALTWLKGEKARLELDGLSSLRRIISAVPAPAFTIDGNQTIIAQNRAFQTLQSSMTADSENVAAAPVVRLGAPLPKLHQVLTQQSDRAVSVPFTLLAEDNRITGQLNVTTMAAAGNRPLFLCIVRKIDDR